MALPYALQQQKNAVCFLPYGERGTRQRAFFAVAEHMEGPYISMGPILPPGLGWESGENGHAAAIIEDDMFRLFYQAREGDDHFHPWRYAIATCPINIIEKISSEYIQSSYQSLFR